MVNKKITPSEKTEWVQLKTRVPRPLRSRLKEEAAILDKPLEEYLLDLFDLRRDSLDKLLAKKQLHDEKIASKRRLDK
jgi:hypothetical protein